MPLTREAELLLHATKMARPKTPPTRKPLKPATATTPRPSPARKPAAKSQPFVTTKPVVNPKTPVGEGAFAITGKAATRLDDSNWLRYPGGPLPFAGGTDNGSVITPQRLWYYKLTRFNPIRQLKPETLAHWFDIFEQGYLRYLDLMVDAIEHRDPILSSVIPKRKSAIKRLRWDVVLDEDLSPEEEKRAAAQKEALFQFYNNVEATSAADLNLRGGLPTLIDQVMNCIGHRYSVHEIVWQPKPDGSLTAKFNWVPLWFFENRTGKLRFLAMDYALDGMSLRDGSFLLSVGQGLLEPCAVAYMYKHLCLRDWLMYCEKHGMPGIHGKTDAPANSDQYNALVNAVHDIATDFSCVTGSKDTIEKIDFSRTGELPYPHLVEYMDRVMTTIWRGADLSTISGRTSQGGQGASLQGKEEYHLQCADASMVSEILNTQVDPLVLKWHFGEGEKSLCHFKIIVPPNIEATTDIAVINALLSWGCEDIGQKQVLEHFGIGEMMDGDVPCQTPQQTMMENMPQVPSSSAEQELSNEDRFHQHLGTLFANAVQLRETDKLLVAAREELAKDTARALKPLREAVEATLLVANEQRMARVHELRGKVPGIIAEINKDPANAPVLAQAMSAAWFNGLFVKRKVA